MAQKKTARLTRCNTPERFKGQPGPLQPGHGRHAAKII